MSGGPIFGLKHNEADSKYRVVAIQRWWKEEHRVISACYLRILCEWLEGNWPPPES